MLEAVNVYYREATAHQNYNHININSAKSVYSQLNFTARNTKGKFEWVVLYVIIFLKVQFCIRLTVVAYRGKKIST